MKPKEKELQEKILSGENTEGFPETEIKAYQQVFKALGKEKDYSLSPGFADKMTAMVEAKHQLTPSHDMLWMALSIAGLTGFLIFTIIYTGATLDLSFLGTISRYWIFMAIGLVLVILIQVIDMKLIHPRFR